MEKWYIWTLSCLSLAMPPQFWGLWTMANTVRWWGVNKIEWTSLLFLAQSQDLQPATVRKKTVLLENWDCMGANLSRIWLSTYFLHVIHEEKLETAICYTVNIKYCLTFKISKQPSNLFAIFAFWSSQKDFPILRWFQSIHFTIGKKMLGRQWYLKSPQAVVSSQG